MEGVEDIIHAFYTLALDGDETVSFIILASLTHGMLDQDPLDKMFVTPQCQSEKWLRKEKSSSVCNRILFFQQSYK